jgi:hypothetical protein
MAKRDSLGRGPRYKAVRKRVTALVRRDKEMSNLAKLSESKNSPAVFWEIANAAVGKPRQPLPASVRNTEAINTKGNLKAANVVYRKFEPAGELKTAIERALRCPGAEIRGEKIISPLTLRMRVGSPRSSLGSRPPTRSAPMGSRWPSLRWGPTS